MSNLVQRLEITAHPQLEKSLGYRGDARWVAWRWEPEIDQLICSDGKIVSTGNNLAWLVFLQHDLVQPVLEDYNLGKGDRHSLLLDRTSRNLYIGQGTEIQNLLEQPESLALLTCLDRNTKGDSLRDSFASRKFGETWQQQLAKTTKSDQFRHFLNLIPVSIVATLIGALAVGTGMWVIPTAQQKLAQKNAPTSPVNFEANCYLGNSYKFSSHVGSVTGNKELHLIAAYEATSPQDNGNPSKNAIEVKVQRKNKPIILALSAYEPINWKLTIEPGAVIEKIIINGYEKQSITGVSGIPIEEYSYKGNGKSLSEGDFMYQWESTTDSSSNSPSIVTKLEEISQTNLTSFQGCYRGTSFMIK
ncbi:MAG: hypothetical protein EAZ78_19515 [Oscillatoriales cyanobacterium]|uniref:hypothetical protein n=1 Tax=Microcoleus anatoxicus TaxID=2705319 RepID=UPI002970C4F7|nr:MAG: hypothetical protein EA000_02745 [Oscillatoriales cyanobacterium]TAD92893.1 MAG: hypothetical protein EAZ98_24690 [Oscillatoriales cyanobacterium]TAF00916.1 MAG: hypothetical protein EAZ78_19515 [Oscillatoriales cyanobacterium]TAF36790.1 MAG: hypothetical protein EAZ68_15880 [Oscillatoriales cyanobacterium]TAF70872.1 MAG: hypothetical protein EAZ59_03140 [Oscillatoriales cyanobacterium]